jgi:hypothetical protein
MHPRLTRRKPHEDEVDGGLVYGMMAKETRMELRFALKRFVVFSSQHNVKTETVIVTYVILPGTE